MRNFQKLVAVIALSGLCFAAPVPSDSGTAKKSTKKHAAVVKKDMTSEQLKELKQQMEQQQAATQQLQEQLKQTQQQLQSTQQQLSQAQATANAANAKATTVETNTSMQVQKVQADVSDVKSAMKTTEASVADAEKKVNYLEHPASIAYKGIRITPGGYLENTFFYRSHATLSDQATPFSGIPLEGFAGGSPVNAAQSGENPRLSEVGFTARDSRITLRADADAGTTKLTGYYEMDFFGTSPTANYSQTSSYTPRLRQAWGRAKFADGWTITGGQMWNLITLNRRGTDADNSNLWIPNIMEAQYSVGYDWGRFSEFRISKQFDKHVNFALGVVQPTMLSSANNETGSVAGVATPGIGLLGNSLVTACSTTTTATLASTTICTNSPLYTTNLAPDLVVKLTYDDAKIGHYEVKALGRAFRDRIVPGATVDGNLITSGYNKTVYGQGIGAGAVIPVVAGKVDLIAQGLYGKGVSRYEDSGQYDVVIRLDGDHSMQPMKSYSYLAGFETHPNKKVEIDALFGQEHYYQDLYPVFGSTTGAVTGYGAASTSVAGCFFENGTQATAALAAGDTCAPNNKTLWNAKLYGYYDLYKGPMGTLRYGAEVDYIERTTWAGNAGTTAAPIVFQPKGNDKTGFVTMRYIFP